MFAPSRGRELKSFRDADAKKLKVRPLAGAGIEIAIADALLSEYPVRPLAGAGIEIGDSGCLHRYAGVRPLAGAGSVKL